MESSHTESCRSLEFTGGIPWPCNCGKARHDAEMVDIQGRLSSEQRRAARLEVEREQLRDALSEILHLSEADNTFSDAQEIAYSALQLRK